MIPLPDSYSVRLVDMPVNEGGMIMESPDGHINVYINARLSNPGQIRAATHEYEHWLHDDLNNGDDIKTVEYRAGHHRNKLSRLAMLKRARNFIPAKPKRIAVYHSYEDWKDDVIHKMGYME